MTLKYNKYFWGIYEDEVPTILKDFVFGQYLSKDTIFIYCDASASTENGYVTVACNFIGKTNSMVKYQAIKVGSHPSMSLIGEFRAVIFALNMFEKYIYYRPKKIVIYSDVFEIIAAMEEKVSFKVKELSQEQRKLISTLIEKRRKNPHLIIEIKHLNFEKKKFNPFHKAAHNAALSLLRSISK